MLPRNKQLFQGLELLCHSAAFALSYINRPLPPEACPHAATVTSAPAQSCQLAGKVLPMKSRVLVVDDDRLVADTICLIYKANGFDSEARYSAAEGLERARSYAPDLLLCDVTMPDVSGLELAESVAELLPDTRMLMLSAYSSNAAYVRAHARRASRPLKLLSKPCRPEDLLRESRALLGTP